MLGPLVELYTLMRFKDRTILADACITKVCLQMVFRREKCFEDRTILANARSTKECMQAWAQGPCLGRC